MPALFSLTRPAVPPIRGVHISADDVLLPLSFPKDSIVVGQEVVCLFPLADTRPGRAGQSVVDYVRGRITHLLPGPWLLVDFPEQVRALPLLCCPLLTHLLVRADPAVQNCVPGGPRLPGPLPGGGGLSPARPRP